VDSFKHSNELWDFTKGREVQIYPIYLVILSFYSCAYL